MSVEIICADAREALAAMPDGSVHACITSPPYWGLRDYGLKPVVWGDAGCEHEWAEIVSQPQHSDDGISGSTLEGGKATQAATQRTVSTSAFCRRCNAWRGTLGLEPTPELYVEHIVQVMREVRRVLRDDATLWLNLGDSYSGGGRDYRDPGKRLNSDGRLAGLEKKGARPPTPDGLKPKDLTGIPWRVAFALQADGWWLRSDIVWSKPNPMPESVTDRPTRSHEYVFLLAKSARYYYDADAIREPQTGNTHSRRKDGRRDVNPETAKVGNVTHLGWEDSYVEVPGGRNRRSVWEIATQPYAKAHFATFPEKLVEPCILAGTSEWGCCPECGAPWGRVVERESGYEGGRRHDSLEKRGLSQGTGWKDGSQLAEAGAFRHTTGWRSTCKHGAGPVPGTVLDIFAGSGTVGLVAERLGRHSVLIDASEDYCRMARERTAQMGLMETA